MRIQPRQQLLDIWRSTARASFGNGEWAWGGRESPNSVSDAEQILCLLQPATSLANFQLDNPDQTDEDILDALRVFGNAAQIPRRIVDVLTDYFERYSAEDGTPTFHGGTYFTTTEASEDVAEPQFGLDVVESYAVSITLTLATMTFTRSFATVITRPDLREDVTRLEAMASRRLTAAMVGLLRSFTVNAFDIDSSFGRHLLQMVNQDRMSERRFTADLTRALRDVTAGLRDLRIGSGQVPDLDSPNRLYECGWSWGVIRDAPTIDFVEDPAIVQPDGYALDAPFLYFTVVALDGLADLFSPRTRRLGLLNDAQQRLSAALNLRWDMTQSYWSVIATFGSARWPIEDLPWHTTDGAESDYYSLLVTSIAARDLALRRGTDVDLARLGAVLTELANRARITRRPFENDPGVRLHYPGIAVTLDGSEKFGPQLTWQATDFAPLLLKRAVQVAELINDIELRGQLTRLVDEVWDHVLLRCHRDVTGHDPWNGLWDQPANAFPAITVWYGQPSWHHTIRVLESLLFAANLTSSGPLRAPDVSAFAFSLLTEAEHLFDQEQLAGSTEAGSPLRAEINTVRASITRARDIIELRPGSATALLIEALRRLDQLAAARQEGGS